MNSMSVLLFLIFSNLLFAFFTECDIMFPQKDTKVLGDIMKNKIFYLLLIVLCCFGLVACGDEPMRPIDYPNTAWQCKDENIKFSVSADGKVTDATMLDKNGAAISISIVFTDMKDGKVSITNVAETETYLSGTCTYDNDMFSIFVTDLFNPNISITTTRLTFERT